MLHRQPNARFRSPDDLDARAREHFEVAASLEGWFDRARFVERFKVMYPDRSVDAAVPSDYCYNRETKGNRFHPRFLEWDEESLYRHVGLGEGSHKGAPEIASPGTPAYPRTAPRSPARGARFRPRHDVGLVLDPDVAKQAILAYNRAPRVQALERRAFLILGSGFRRGQVAQQLETIDTIYRTRCAAADLIVLAERIELGFEPWQALLQKTVPLTEGVTDRSCLADLLRFFLDSNTEKRPRSLATKALHFASPQCFIPADGYSANMLGQLLDAGSWTDTKGLDTEAMALWFHDYLTAVHGLAAANAALVPLLLRADEDTGGDARVRSWPKILDKLLWWLGRPEAQHRQLFVPGHPVDWPGRRRRPS